MRTRVHTYVRIHQQRAQKGPIDINMIDIFQNLKELQTERKR